jgi:hypothetical protein
MWSVRWSGGKTPKLCGDIYALGLIHLQLPAKGTQLDQKVLDISLARSVHWQGGDGSLGLKGNGWDADLRDEGLHMSC